MRVSCPTSEKLWWFHMSKWGYSCSIPPMVIVCHVLEYLLKLLFSEIEFGWNQFSGRCRFNKLKFVYTKTFIEFDQFLKILLFKKFFWRNSTGIGVKTPFFCRLNAIYCYLKSPLNPAPPVVLFFIGTIQTDRNWIDSGSTKPHGNVIGKSISGGG